MRILVVGAGAIGGYFGARLLAAGRDVTFLVRPRRAAELAKTGLVVKSRLGDLALPSPPTVTADAIKAPFDLVLVSCKAFDLDGAMDSFAPAVGPYTAILPLLNGMGHLDALVARFGKAAVLGGQCAISTVLDRRGSRAASQRPAPAHLRRARRRALGPRIERDCRRLRRCRLRRRLERDRSFRRCGRSGCSSPRPPASPA